CRKAIVADRLLASPPRLASSCKGKQRLSCPVLDKPYTLQPIRSHGTMGGKRGPIPQTRHPWHLVGNDAGLGGSALPCWDSGLRSNDMEHGRCIRRCRQ